MDVNTVTLSLEDYNELIDFKRNIKSGHVLVELTVFGVGHYSRTSYYTNDEVAKELSYKNDFLQNEIKELKNKVKELEKRLNKDRTLS